MEQYISKAAVVAEIERRINEINIDSIEDWRYRLQLEHDIEVMKNILSFIDTMEVKDEVVSTDPIKAMTEALRMEYEKGRADAFKRAAESFCKATCNGNPPRSTCTSLGTCKEYSNFIKFMKE